MKNSEIEATEVPSTHLANKPPIGEQKQNLQLREQVAADLENKLKEFNDHKKGMRIMAAYMGIHEKTLKRLMECQNRPGYQTVFKIYRALYNLESNNEVIDMAPEVIRDFLLNSDPIIKNMSNGVSFKLNIEEELRKDPIFCEIYFLCNAGETSREYIGFQYGAYGIDILEKMIEQRVVISSRKNFYVRGPNQASLGPESLPSIGIHLAKQFHKPQNSDALGENFQSLYVAGLSEEAYNNWLAVDEEAYAKKVAIAKDPSNIGNTKAYTYSSTDTLLPATTRKGLLH